MPKTLYMPLAARPREKFYRRNVFWYTLGGLCILFFTYWLWWTATCCGTSGTESMNSHINYSATTDTRKMESSLPILKLMSWNVQGLMGAELEKRTDAVKSVILKEEPDAVFFQELIPSSYKQLVNALGNNFDSVLGTDETRGRYFTGVFYNKNRLKMQSREIRPFKNSGNYFCWCYFHLTTHKLEFIYWIWQAFLCCATTIVAGIEINQWKIKIALLSTHLESLPQFKTQRLEQLAECFDVCTSLPEEYNVVFGGDLNLEDGEENGLVPEILKDLWIECGSLDALKYTWDFKQNKNDQLPDNEQPQRRYDRLYFRSSSPTTMHPENFNLLGKDMVEGTNYHPSDHWALLATFRLLNESMAD